MLPKWGKIQVRDIASIVNGTLAGEGGNTEVTGISTDSRTLKKGEVFWALKGERFDGHDYVKDALRAGASGVVVELHHLAKEISQSGHTVIYVSNTLNALGELAAWWRREHKAKVAGITGSAGKTTTKEMAASILGLGHEVLKNEGNLNNLIGLPVTLLKMEEHHGRAVVEMGMNRPGEIARLTQIADPDIGLITNVGKAHLEGLGDLLGVARAKLEMAEQIRDEAALILNGDDQVLMETAAGLKKEVFTFGLGRQNHIRAENISFRKGGNGEFVLLFGGVKAKIRLEVPGIHNVMNALAAASIALLLDEPMERICQGLEKFKSIKGRFVLRNIQDDITLVDDTYNANPLSLKAALDSIRSMEYRPDNLIIGLADMLELGVESNKLHYDAGKWVAELAPRLFVITGEYGSEMARGAKDFGLPDEQVVVAKDAEEMAAVIMENMRPGDAILLKGSRLMGLDKLADKLSRRNDKGMDS